jgi:membrane-bound ClpP family serine protease
MTSWIWVALPVALAAEPSAEATDVGSYFWMWALLLLALGLGFAALEVFIPSGGILGFLACASVVAGIILGFNDERQWVGPTILVGAVVGLPSVVVMAFKWLPRTEMGRRVLLMGPESEDILPDDPEMDYLKGLVGHVAPAKCKMRPAGAISIEGRTVDAVSEGMPIEAGQMVRVIEVSGHRVVVRPVDDAIPSESADDPLRRPIDSVAPDPFEEPPPG